MKLRPASLILPLFAAAILAGCDSPTISSDPNEVTFIRATTSFGFCLGYCATSLEITPTEAVFVEDGREVAPRRRTVPLSSADWTALVAAFDRARMESLPDVVGCPDCADAGAESLQVYGLEWSKSVTFDHGAPMPQLEPLLGRVRALRDRVEAN